MSKKVKSKRVVESLSGSDSDEVPEKKKMKSCEDDEESEIVEKKSEKVSKEVKSKKTKKADSSKEVPSKELNEDGSEFFTLGRNRRVQMSEFKGTKSIDIREYYLDKKTDEMKPGKKGISLNASEWKNLLAIADQIHFD